MLLLFADTIASGTLVSFSNAQFSRNAATSKEATIQARSRTLRSSDVGKLDIDLAIGTLCIHMHLDDPAKTLALATHIVT